MPNNRKLGDEWLGWDGDLTSSELSVELENGYFLDSQYYQFFTNIGLLVSGI